MPQVMRSSTSGDHYIDLFSRLLDERIVFMGSRVDDESANLVAAQLLYLEHLDPERDIHLYVNSPGGSPQAKYAIIDTMNFIRPDVSTICIGRAASAAAVVAATGAKGKRYALPNSKFMIHQPSGMAGGTASDIEIAAATLLATRQRSYEMLAEATGNPIDVIARDCNRDLWMTAQEALEYGLIDGIISER